MKTRRTLISVALVVMAAAFVLDPAAPAASDYKVVHRFAGGAMEGAYPIGSLVFDASGNLYGTTSQGSGFNYGTVFKLSRNPNGSWTDSVLYSFSGPDGRAPTAGLVFDKAGNLYGTTSEGGSDDGGVVFKLTRQSDGSWTESVLYAFTGKDGFNPNAGVIFDAAGNLYGTTYIGGVFCNDIGCGVVFKLTPKSDGSWIESVLYDFKDGADGGNPMASLTFDTAGNLYGTTMVGGKHAAGVAFELTPKSDGSWTQRVLHRFTVSDGENPIGGLIFDKAGNLYGTTYGGGSSGGGVVFKLTPKRDGSWMESVLRYFARPANPYSGVIFDAAGALYGTTVNGGSSNKGKVFKLTPNVEGNWTYGVLHNFRGNALHPYTGLVLDSASTLYGTTHECTARCFGVVFELVP